MRILKDIHGDGDLDLFATRGYSPVARPVRYDRSNLYRNDDVGSFTHDFDSPLSTADNPAAGNTWGDIEQDGDLDAFVSTQHGRPDAFYRNHDGNWPFQRIAQEFNDRFEGRTHEHESTSARSQTSTSMATWIRVATYYAPLVCLTARHGPRLLTKGL